ncbi:MAG: ATP-binding protein [Elusimicrobiota bacterium]
MELIVESGLNKGAVYKLTQKETSIGRHLTNTIVLNNEKVSRNHSVIEQRADKFFIKDLGSTNGTFVNNLKVSPSTEQELHNGDFISIGSFVLRATMISETEKKLGIAHAVFTTIGTVENAKGLNIQIKEDGDTISPTATIIRFAKQQVIPDIRTAGAQQQDTKAYQKALQNLKTIYEINNAISSIFEINELLNKIMETIFSIIKADRGYILLVNSETGEWEIPVNRKRIHDGRTEIPTVSRSIINRVLSNSESILTSDAATDDRFLKEGTAGQSIVSFGISSVMCVPLKTQDKIIGVINVDTKGTKGTFTQDELELLSAIGDVAGVAIQNARLVEKNIKITKMTAIGQTVACLSHDIKNILFGLDAGAMVVEMGIKKHEMSRIENGWIAVKRCKAKIADLVLDMLSLSKDREPSLEEVDIKKFIDEIITIVQSRADEKKSQLKYQYADQLPTMFLDKKSIERAVLNLITNAIDAVEKNKGEIIVSAEFDTTSDSLVLKVTDNGAGIPADNLPHIFELDFSTKGTKGTGIGLAVVKKVITEHKGTIEVASAVNEGTTFTIRLKRLPK